MVIQHSRLALNGMRQLKISEGKKTKSTEKLSSGYKINRAADNAAGLAISEKMRAQIRGMQRAAENAQDGISLVQTAEGAMQESQNILHRMRELSVQAANDTNTEDDRSQIKLELDELREELDHIANGTEYNTMKLINGDFSLEADDMKTRFQEYLKGSWLQDALNRIEDGLGIGMNKDVTLKVQFQSLGSNAVATMASANGGDKFTLTINSDFTDGLTMGDFSTDSGPIAGGHVLDRLITHEMTHAVTRHNMSSSLGAPTWFIEGIAEAVQGTDRTSPETEATVRNIMTNFSHGVSGEPAYQTGFYAVSYMAYNTTTGNFTNFLEDMDSGASFDQLIAKYYGVADEAEFVNKLKDMAANNTSGFLGACHVTLGDGKEDSIIDWDQTPENAVTNVGGYTPIEHSEEKIAMNGRVWTIQWDNPKSSGEDMTLQIGANAGQELSFYIGDMRSKALIGTDEIDVSTFDIASRQITRFDHAIQKVSTYRSSLGAIQNRLEYAIDGLQNSAENLTAAESEMRDTDMAEEMVVFSKNDILAQAGQSVLAQANQSTQGVLSLLS